jgi:hypothetical protein
VALNEQTQGDGVMNSATFKDHCDTRNFGCQRQEVIVSK